MAPIEPVVRPGTNLDTLLGIQDLAPGQREFLTYLTTPEGKQAFDELAAMSRPWSDDPADRRAFIVAASQKVREMSLMGTGSKSQAELRFTIYGSREAGLRVFPEIRVGSPNSAMLPPAYDRLRADPKVELLVDMHTHPALGAEYIDAAGNRLSSGSSATGFSQQDLRAFSYLRESQREIERATGAQPKTLEFGNVSVLGGTVTMALFVGNDIRQFVIGSGGDVLEDRYAPTDRLYTVPGLVRPPEGTSERKQEAILDAQGYPIELFRNPRR